MFIFFSLFDVSILCTLVSSLKRINIVSWFIISSLQLGTIVVGLLFFGQRIQGLCFCYLLNTKFTWNKFKCKILNNLNHTNFHGGGDFSHMYVIMHQYFVKKLEMQKLNTSNFTNNLTCFLAWLLLYMLSTLGAIKYKFSEYKKSTKWK